MAASCAENGRAIWGVTPTISRWLLAACAAWDAWHLTSQPSCGDWGPALSAAMLAILLAHGHKRVQRPSHVWCQWWRKQWRTVARTRTLLLAPCGMSCNVYALALLTRWATGCNRPISDCLRSHA